MKACGAARSPWAPWSGLVPPEDLDLELVRTSPGSLASLGVALSWHARVVSTLNNAPVYVLPRVAQCDAAVITSRHDPWAGLYKRPIGLPAIRTLTSPYNVGFTVARNMALMCLGLVHKHIVLLTEAEEKAIETNAPEPEHVPFPWEELPLVLKRGGLNSCMDMTVLSTRGVLDWMVGDLLLPSRCSAETVVRMHTDMRRTSRALAPAYPMAQRFTRVVKTAFWSEITLYLSEWLVTSVLETAWLVIEGKDRFLERILLRTVVNGARCASLWLAVSVGNGVGASSPRMRPLTMLVGANAAALVVNRYWRRASVRIEARAFGDDGGDGGNEADGKKGGSADGEDGGGRPRVGAEGSGEDAASSVQLESTFFHEFAAAHAPAHVRVAAETSFEEAGRTGADEGDWVGGSDYPAGFAAQPSISPTGVPGCEPREDVARDMEAMGSQLRQPQRPPSGIPSLPVRKRKSPPSGQA